MAGGRAMVTGGGLVAYLTLAAFVGLECVGIPLPGETALIARRSSPGAATSASRS